MNVIRELLSQIPIPKLVKIKQTFDDTKIEDIGEAVRQEMKQPTIQGLIQPGARIAIACGSRGVANIDRVAAEVVAEIRAAGGDPFIVPAMGSHGGATAEGQKNVLAHLGITEQSVAAPILSSMNVIKIGELENGLPIYVDQYAAESDGIVVINRIKPHTAFRGPNESGLMKMLSIGLGKQKGAEACHQLGFKHMAEHVPAMAKVMMAKLPVLFGVGLVENAYDHTCLITAIPAPEIEEKEKELLQVAKSLMPRIMFDQMDVLMVHEIGKNISGDGMDPNITGKYPTPYATGGPSIEKVVVCDLTDETHGNANGLGTADFTTERVFNMMDRAATYANALTSTVVHPVKIPMLLENDREAIKAAVKTCNRLDFTQVRLVYIKNTLKLGEIYISESMVEEAQQIDGIEVLSEPQEIRFDKEGYLVNYWA